MNVPAVITCGLCGEPAHRCPDYAVTYGLAPGVEGYVCNAGQHHTVVPAPEEN